MDSQSSRKRDHLEELADAWLAGDIAPDDAAHLRAADQPTLDELLTRLAADPAGLAMRHLLVLSDLSREEVAQVRLLWPTIPVDRRRTIIRQLVSLAEEDLSLLLGRLLRVALDDDDPAVRRLAIGGLATEEDTAPDLVGPLVQILYNDDDSATRAAAARALGAYVLAGELDGHRGPGISHTPLAISHVTLSPGARVELPWRQDFNALVYALAGSGTVGAESAPIRMGQTAVLVDGDTVVVQADETQESRSPQMEVFIIGGVPLRQPVFQYGPFVMSTRQEVIEAFEDFQAGRFGRIPPQAIQPFRA